MRKSSISETKLFMFKEAITKPTDLPFVFCVDLRFVDIGGSGI